MPGSVLITGGDLTVGELVAIAREGVSVTIDDRATARMRRACELVCTAAHAGRPVYGLTTGLGSRVTEVVDAAAGAEFSLRTIRGRATAVGEPLSTELTRAAMTVRLNGLCAGGAGAGPAVATQLAGMLNEGVHPVIPRSGSVGAADLCLMAHLGLGMIGEGECELSGVRLDAGQALAAVGLLPLQLGPKDGLAICSSSAVTVGAAALALSDARGLLAAAQASAALSMEGFRASLTPLDERAVAARPAPGQDWAAAGLRSLLAGGALTEPAAARRLQDPLSFRCASQIHGSLRTALELLSQALGPELNGAADNPLVLADDGEIISTGNFHVPALALALDATAIAIAQVAGAITERQARLKVARLSGLPANLVSAAANEPTRTGLAALTKTAQSLTLEIRHACSPLAILSTVGADGVEDDGTAAAQGALRLGDQLRRLRWLIAVELIVAAQAVELAAPPSLGAGAAATLRCVRGIVPAIGEDRPLGLDVERLAAAVLERGQLLAHLGDHAQPLR